MTEDTQRDVLARRAAFRKAVRRWLVIWAVLSAVFCLISLASFVITLTLALFVLLLVALGIVAEMITAAIRSRSVWPVLGSGVQVVAVVAASLAVAAAFAWLRFVIAG